MLYDVWARFGLGSPTGIDVAGEVGGLVRDPSRTEWRQIDLANGSFGQGVAVTQVQLAAAFAALVNGGQLLQPRVVKAIGDQELPVVSRGQVMDRALAVPMNELMQHVVSSVKFYANRTLVPGYIVGGKTGTAQIWRPDADGGKGAWDPDNYTFSFVGFIAREADHPDLIVAVRIEDARPTVIRAGQQEMPLMSFELFRRIATDAITRPGLVAELDDGSAGGSAAADRSTTWGGRP
jgi:cell division protein FtsI/penicillin-binding protein 2